MTANENDAVTQWAERYEELFGNPPTNETILQAKNGYAKITISLRDGKEPFVYGLAYVPFVVGSELDWFLVDEDDPSYCGIKCILMPRARKEIIARFGLVEGYARVKALRVVSKSQSGKSLLCEVAEF